ncbi:methyltransferase family protein [Algisphaera agarilytica]|uniref:Protein-S-isoprenylcysteine O-methyltransferase Ste14 n=1 Tax=Algisphaera agarilytica TaxID=1385975 RepID=A0A7X0H9J2_9BACT|nr:isoprenylcysteine carboxylmethyltransferase family protein [Algisphaera agarilytica]MBB6430284.1 protein-S-isoprenylcysteine O-methyltransferase Ste14 [Algisphaera agarilytica]
MSQAPANHPTTLQPARGNTAWRAFTAPLFLTLAFVAIHVLDKHYPGAIWFTMPWKMLGWGPIVLGSLLCVAGAGHFAQRRTTIMPRRESRVLVTTGVFALTRNPMYLGMVIILVGVCLIGGSATVWIVPPAFAWVVDRTLIRLEEQMLTQRFGDDFADYRRRVRRWV